MKWGYQKTPHDEWDYAGINVMMLSEQKDKTGKMRKLVTHPDRNGVVYTLDRESGELISADFLDDTVNVFKKVDLKTGVPVRDPEFNTRMDHRTKDACPSAAAGPGWVWCSTCRILPPVSARWALSRSSPSTPRWAVASSPSRWTARVPTAIRR